MSNLHHLETPVPSSSRVSTAGAFETPHASDVPADTSLTTRLRDGAREARTVPVQHTALGGQLIEQIKWYRQVCRDHNIDPDTGLMA